MHPSFRIYSIDESDILRLETQLRILFKPKEATQILVFKKSEKYPIFENLIFNAHF